jgi:hypothetical protein
MADNYLLSAQAIREIKQGLKEVRELKTRLKFGQVTGPRRGGDIYVKLGAYDSTAEGYDGTEVQFAGNGATWTEKFNPRTWGGDSTDLGYIYPIDFRPDLDLGDLRNQVFPVYRMSQGNTRRWGISPREEQRWFALNSHTAGGAYSASLVEWDGAGFVKSGTVAPATVVEANNFAGIDTTSKPVVLARRTLDTSSGSWDWIFEYAPESLIEEGYKVKVTSNDTTPDYLLAKLAAGEAIDLDELNDGANEDAEINVLYQNSIVLDLATNSLELDGDVFNPGNTYYYGTNAGGVKGWYDLAALIDSSISAGIAGLLDCGEGIGFDIDATTGVLTISSQTRPSTDEQGQKNTPLTTAAVSDGTGDCDTWIEYAVNHRKSIVNSENNLELDGDVDDPTDYFQYRQDSTGGQKGWYAPPYEFDGLWLNRDTNYFVQHDHLGDLSATDEGYWRTIDLLGPGDTTHTIKLDTRGHILSIDSVTPPDSTAETLLFEDCYTGSKYFVTDDGTSRTTSKVYVLTYGGADDCYIYLGKVIRPADAVQPSALGVTPYDSCGDCTANSPVYQILDCSDDSLIGYADLGSLPSVDYYYVYESPEWTEAKTGAQVSGQTPAIFTIYEDELDLSPASCDDLTQNKNPIINPAGNAEISTTQSKYGGSSIHLPATGDYLSIPATADWEVGTGDFTIRAWVYIDPALPSSGGSSDFRRIISNGDVTSVNGAFGTAVGYYGGGGAGFEHRGLNFAVRSGGVIYDYISEPLTLNANTWYHVAFIRSSGTLRMYLNGAEVGHAVFNSTSWSNGVAMGYSVGVNDTLEVGRSEWSGSENFEGYLDDVEYAAVARSGASPSQLTPDANSLLLLHGNDEDGADYFFDSALQ